jgi:MerC mercury resistance protein
MTKFLDYAGTSVSWLCMVHCLAMPLLVSFLPIFGLSFLADEITELAIIGCSVCLAIISFLPSYFKQHRKLNPMLLFVGGISMILLSRLVFEENLAGKVIFLLLGAGGITSAHLLNHSYCKSCEAHSL